MVFPKHTEHLIPPRAHSYVHHTARSAHEVGISVVPIRPDGSKRPALREWQTYQHRQATASELERWFRLPDAGVALITGAVSGNLEALDFDDHEVYARWLRRVQDTPHLHRLYERIAWGYEESTPAGGRHLLYRCSTIEGNQKLASRPQGTGQRKTLIETRGEGGLLIVAPSRGRVHPSGKAYLLLRGGVRSITTITPEEREALFSVACACHEMPPEPARPVVLPHSRAYENRDALLRPGDWYNQSASWRDILEPHGWEWVRSVGEQDQWRRPGKTGPGISATTNYQGSDLLYVFSTSALFEPERGYSKFAAYTLLEHGGDFAAAARTLAAQGHGLHGGPLSVSAEKERTII